MAETEEMISLTKRGFGVEEIKELEMREVKRWGMISVKFFDQKMLLDRLRHSKKSRPDAGEVRQADKGGKHEANLMVKSS